MSDQTIPTRSPGRPLRLNSRVGLVLFTTLVELVAIGVVYQIAVDLDCRNSGAYETCLNVRNSLARGFAVLALLLVYVPTRWKSFAFLWDRRASDHRPGIWPWFQVLGVALILAPALFAEGDFAAVFRLSLFPWAVGAILATAGTLLWLAPVAAWQNFFRREGVPVLALLAAGLLAPNLFPLLNRLWAWPPLTNLTFAAAADGLRLFGAVEVDPPRYLLGIDGFIVEVASACSGMQGFALITGLLVGYITLHRRELRFPQVWLLLPIGIAASFVLNVVRIDMLILIGARFSPDLAVNGFHSHAGWLMFTFLSFALIALSRSVPWFQVRTVGGAAPGALGANDWHTALIVPFIVMMLSALVASTFAEQPDLWYPLRAAAMLAALLVFAPLYRALEWRPDAVACAAGLLVGVLWIATQPAASESDAELSTALAALSLPALLGWAGMRIFGTVLLVPFIEEAFFRGFLLKRLDGPGFRRIFAIGAAAALFALLHDRWLAAFMAGLVFGAIMIRRDRLADAVAAHATANLVIAGWAAATGDWSAI